MKSLKSLAITSAFLLTGGIALAAPQQNSATPPQTKAYQAQSMNNNGNAGNMQAVHHVMGTVDNITDSSVTISHGYKGQQKTTDFQVQPNTKKEGNIAAGTRVEVTYKNVNNRHVATTMKAEPSKG